MNFEVGTEWKTRGGWKAVVVKHEEKSAALLVRHDIGIECWHFPNGREFTDATKSDLIAPWHDTPTLWRDMTDEDKAQADPALIYDLANPLQIPFGEWPETMQFAAQGAAHLAKKVECICPGIKNDKWDEMEPYWYDGIAYRVRPAEPDFLPIEAGKTYVDVDGADLYCRWMDDVGAWCQWIHGTACWPFDPDNGERINGINKIVGPAE